MPDDTTTPVVVLATHHHVGIGITRSLGRLGVPVYGIDVDKFSPAFFSRYCRGYFIWDLHHESSDNTLAFLRHVASKIGRRALLIPTSDVGAMLVAEHADRLSDDYIVPRQDPSLIKTLCSKREMYHLAKHWNVPTPETSFPKSRRDVLEYLAEARFPILVKPIYNLVPGLKPWRMVIAHSPEALLSQYDSVEVPGHPNVMLQEYIPGGDEMTWTFNGYFDANSNCLLAFTGRKLRNFPPYFGQASLAICAKNDYVKDTTIEFMKRIGYVGPLDLGYRYDARDGRYKVNDINPRIGAMFRVFEGNNGIDVARALYLNLTGQPVVAAPAPEGRKWIVEDVDMLTSLRYWRDRKFTFVEWLRSFRGIKEAAFLAADDPLPFVGAWMMDFRRGWRERTKQSKHNPDPATRLPPSHFVRDLPSGSSH